MYTHSDICMRLPILCTLESEVPSGLALLRLENLEAVESLGENPEVTLKEFIEDHFKSLTNIPFCIIGDLPSS